MAGPWSLTRPHELSARARHQLVITVSEEKEGAQRRGLQLALLAIAMAAGGYARTTLSPLQEALRIGLALGDNQIALLQGLALGVPMAVASIPLGIAVDRYSRTRLLLALMVLGVAATLLSAAAPTYSVLFAARCLAGVASYSTVPIVMSLLADLYTPAQRGRAMMVVSIGQLSGVSGAFALGGLLLSWPGSGPGDWRWAMLWLAAPLVIVMLVMLASREPPRTGVALEKPTLREVGPGLWRYRWVISPLFAGIVLVETAVGAVLTWAAPTLSRDFGLSPDRIGALMASGLLVSGILGPVIGGSLADLSQRTGGSRRTMSMLSALSLLSVPAGCFAIAPEIESASILLLVVVTLLLATAVMGMALFTIVIPNELRGVCVAALVGVNILFALGLAPLIVSILSTTLGGPGMIGTALTVVCATACLLAATIFSLGRWDLP
jgi:MFS family permease